MPPRLPRYGRLRSSAPSVSLSPATAGARRIRPKQRERNIAAAILGMIVIATLATALAEPRWFYLHGGKCDYEYIGVYMFFDQNSEHNIDMELCVTEKIAGLMRVVIAFCFVGIGTSLFGFILDTFGPSKRILKIIRRHGIGNIVTVVLCAAINLFCYWISDLIDEHLNANKRGTGSLVKVQFDIGYYLIAGAGGLSVIVVATNMLRRYPMYDDSGDDGIDDWENEFVNLPASFTPPPPPPPAYTP